MDETEYYNICRDCGWFDPTCDKCELHGTVAPDDTGCESFFPAED